MAKKRTGSKPQTKTFDAHRFHGFRVASSARTQVRHIVLTSWRSDYKKHTVYCGLAVYNDKPMSPAIQVALKEHTDCERCRARYMKYVNTQIKGRTAA